MKHKKIFYCIISIFAVRIGLFISNRVFYNEINVGRTYKGLPVISSYSINMYDMSTPEKVVGVVDYVFVAKIDSIKETDYRDPIEVEVTADGSKTETITNPYTIYNVTVIDNIKGELPVSEQITITQNGGITEDKKMYILPDGAELLQVGEYYIILAYAVSEQGELEINSSETYVLLSDNSTGASMSSSIFENSISTNAIVKKYQKAYKNQEVPEQKKDNFTSKYDISLKNKE